MKKNKNKVLDLGPRWVATMTKEEVEQMLRTLNFNHREIVSEWVEDHYQGEEDEDA